MVIMLIAQGQVAFLVVLYSINVFITFSLSQFGMCRHWLQVHRQGGKWQPKFLINFIGLLLTTTVLIILLRFKFFQGGWLTLVLTSGFIIMALLVKRHYLNTWRALKRLDDILVNIPRPEKTKPIPSTVGREEPTAVLLVSGFKGFGIHTFFSVQKLFPNIFKRYVFISVGELDTGQFKGIHEVENLRANTESDLKKYVRMANDFGLYAEYRFDLSVNSIETLAEICNQIKKEYPQAVFFVGKLVFSKESIFTHILHNETAFRLQRRLVFEGQQAVLMPIRVY
jgi:hypothetical protein